MSFPDTCPSFNYWRFTTKPNQVPTLFEVCHYVLIILITGYGMDVGFYTLEPDSEPEEHIWYSIFSVGSEIGWVHTEPETLIIESCLHGEELQTLAELLNTVYEHTIVCDYSEHMLRVFIPED